MGIKGLMELGVFVQKSSPSFVSASSHLVKIEKVLDNSFFNV